MPQVAFSTEHRTDTLFRQTPGGLGTWQDWQFRIADTSLEEDWLVVFDDLRTPVETNLPKARRALVVSEPPGIRTYRPGFLNQFGLLLSPMAISGFSGLHAATDVGLPWFIGLDMSDAAGARSRWTFEEIRDLPMGEKQHALSAVISTKTLLPRHRRRLEFVRALAERMGVDFHLFGRGFTEIRDKADVILPFSHHLVIENNVEENFFTEKLCDAYLGWSLPIFSGCADIERHFPAGSLIRFDLEAPDALERVVAGFAAPIDAARRAAMAEARNRVLYRANLFARLSEVLGRHAGPIGARIRTRVHPNSAFPLLLTRLSSGWRRMRRSLLEREPTRLNQSGR